jgi:hypothetical protein
LQGLQSLLTLIVRNSETPSDRNDLVSKSAPSQTRRIWVGLQFAISNAVYSVVVLIKSLEVNFPKKRRREQGACYPIRGVVFVLLALKHVEHELVPAVVSAALRILIVPLAIVNRNPHFGRIAIVHVFGTSVVVLSPEVLGIIDVGIVIKTFHIARAGLAAPHPAIGALLGLSLGCRQANA